MLIGRLQLTRRAPHNDRPRFCFYRWTFDASLGYVAILIGRLECRWWTWKGVEKEKPQ